MKSKKITEHDEHKQHKSRPATVDVVVMKEDKILLIKRESEPYKDSWALPGGFVKIDEDTLSAAKREVKEETGVSVEILGIIGVYSDPKRDERHTISVAYIGFPLNPDSELKPQKNETKEVKWFEIDKLPELAFDHKQIVEDAISVLNHSSCDSCSECSCE